MRRASLWLLLIGCLLATAPALGQDCKTADGLFAASQGVFTKDRTAQTMLDAIGKLEHGTQACPGHERSWALLCELYWQHGDQLPQQNAAHKQTRMQWFKKGIAAGDRALALNPRNVQAVFFRGCNLAAEADMKGWSSSLWMFDDLKAIMVQTDKLDPDYIWGGTGRFWIEMLTRVPLWLAGRFGYTVEERVALVERQKRAEPRFFSNYYYLAAIYWKQGEHDKALAELEHIIKTDPAVFPEQAGVNRMEQRRAYVRWKEFTGQAYPGR